WNPGSVPEGSHTLTARAVDTAGTAATSVGASVTIGNTNLLLNASLETASGSTPTCWLLGGYGTNTFAWTRTSDAHSGSFAEKLDGTAFTDGDRKFLNTQDAGACAPAVVAGHSYTVTVWYKSNVPARIFAFYRNASGTWTYWASATFPASASWTQATWLSPQVPAGATRVSAGLGLSAVASVTQDDFGLLGCSRTA